jgi:hypothetical protein
LENAMTRCALQHVLGSTSEVPLVGEYRAMPG